MTELYILPVSQAREIPAEACERLFPKRTERARCYRQRADADRCIAAGALLAFVLGAAEDEIAANEWGKPYIKEKSVFFSLSHSGDYAVLAVDGTEVGADIERHAPVNRKVAERVFTQDELLWMEKEPETRFFSLWTVKESVIKLDGRGMALPMRSFSVLPLLGGGAELFGRRLFAYTERIADCTVSVCAERPLDGLSPRVLTAGALMKYR